MLVLLLNDCSKFLLNNVNLCQFDHSGPRIPCALSGCDLLAWGHSDIAVQSLWAAKAHHHLEGSRPEHPRHWQQLSHVLRVLLVSWWSHVCTTSILVWFPEVEPGMQLLFSYLVSSRKQLRWSLCQHKCLALLRRETGSRRVGSSQSCTLRTVHSHDSVLRPRPLATACRRAQWTSGAWPECIYLLLSICNLATM